uniref:Peptidase S39 domain-containing protein n=1 Tax=Atrato Sobemo-like virus 6 TaxID=2689352 RepID=A0A6B9KGN5_9VIRU|nr:hypothetical protein [Atrato Sobemo-like virus 6]
MDSNTILVVLVWLAKFICKLALKFRDFAGWHPWLALVLVFLTIPCWYVLVWVITQNLLVSLAIDWVKMVYTCVKSLIYLISWPPAILATVAPLPEPTWYEKCLSFIEPLEGKMNYWLLIGLCVTGLLALVYLTYKLVLPLFWALCRAMQRTKDLYTTGVERMMAGSDFFNAPIPNFQAEVHVAFNGLYHFSGNCACVTVPGLGDRAILVTAAHVLSGASHVRVKTARASLDIDLSRWVQAINCTDMSVVVITNDEKSTLGLSSGKLRAAAMTTRAYAHVNSRGRAAIGYVRESPDDTDFGRIVFDGSTIKGYSGSPYYMGNVIFGMHTGYNTMNGGMDAAYMVCMLKFAIRQNLIAGENPEDSDAWVEDQLMKGRDHKITRTGGGDEWQVKLAGQYFIVDDERMNELYNKARNTGFRLNLDVGERAKRPEDEESATIGVLQLLEAYKASQELIRKQKQAILDLQTKVLTLETHMQDHKERIVDCEIDIDEIYDPPPADELPTVPRGSLSFDDNQSGNGAAPHANVGAIGQQKEVEPVPSTSGVNHKEIVSKYLNNSEIWATVGRKQTPVQQSDRSHFIPENSRNRRRAHQRREEKKLLKFYTQRFGPIVVGEQTLGAQMTRKFGSEGNLTKR